MSNPDKPEVTPSAPPAPQPSMRRPPPGAMALPGMAAPGGLAVNTITVTSPTTEAEIAAAEQIAVLAVASEMAASTTESRVAPVPQPRSTVKGPPAGSMALPGLAAPVGPVAVEASSSAGPSLPTEAQVPINEEKRPPVEDVSTVVTAVAASAAITEYAASQMAPNVAGTGQQAYEAPPSYSETIQQGGYAQPQPGYNPQAGYQQQPYPPQGYPPQPLYPQAGVPQPGYAPGGYQAAPVPTSGGQGTVPENVGYGATATAAYAVTVPPQPTERTPAIVTISGSQQLPAKTNDWNKGICGCCSNCELCLLSWLCPCYMVGKNAEALGHSCCLYGVGSIIPLIRCVAQIILRTEIRHRHGIKGSEFGDFCYVCFCTVCSLTQEANEVRVMATQEIERE